MLFVAGCHRSGTSFLSGLLTSIADSVGFPSPLSDRAVIMKESLANQSGYHETWDLVGANELILRQYGSRWDAPWLRDPAFDSPEGLRFLEGLRQHFTAHLGGSFWVDKDPRLCLTIGAMKHVFLRRIPIMAIVRHPFEVALSLQFRDGFSPDHALYLWSVYTFLLFSRRAEFPVAAFEFSEFSMPTAWPVERLLGAFQSAAKSFSVDAPEVIALTVDRVRDIIATHYRPLQVRQSADDRSFSQFQSSLLAEPCLAVWSDLQKGIRGECLDPAAMRSLFSPLMSLILGDSGGLSLGPSTSDLFFRQAEAARQAEQEKMTLGEEIQHLRPQLLELQRMHGQLVADCESLRVDGDRQRAELQAAYEIRLRQCSDRLQWNRGRVRSLERQLKTTGQLSAIATSLSIRFMLLLRRLLARTALPKQAAGRGSR